MAEPAAFTLRRIERIADDALRAAGVLGVVPTPLDAVAAVAGVRAVAPMPALPDAVRTPGAVCSARCGSRSGHCSSTPASRACAGASPRRTSWSTRSAPGTRPCCARTPRTSCSATPAPRSSSRPSRRRHADLPARGLRGAGRRRTVLDPHRARAWPSATARRATPPCTTTSPPIRLRWPCSWPGASRAATAACRSGAASSPPPSRRASADRRAARRRARGRQRAARARRGGAHDQRPAVGHRRARRRPVPRRGVQQSSRGADRARPGRRAAARAVGGLTRSRSPRLLSWRAWQTSVRIAARRSSGSSSGTSRSRRGAR